MSSIDLFFRRDCGAGGGPAVDAPRLAAGLPPKRLEDWVVASADALAGAAGLPMLPNRPGAEAGADEEGTDVPVDSAVEAGFFLSWAFPRLPNSDGALVEGAVVPELVGLFGKLKPPGAAAGDAIGFAVEASGTTDLDMPNSEGVVCAVDAFVGA